MDNKNNIFYVYEWFNKDTGEVFYVGKGKNNRYKTIKGRNQYFLNYYNKHKCDVRKVKVKLLEREAFDLEIDLIAKYRSVGQCKCNIANGGEGMTYDKNSWPHIFRSLQYSHDIMHRTKNMHNEECYDSDNLKTKTLEELKRMKEEYEEYKENAYFFKRL